MDGASAVFVQFPHPGGEHHPPSDDMPWNVGGHRRKYLRGPGRHVDADDHMSRSPSNSTHHWNWLSTRLCQRHEEHNVDVRDAERISDVWR